MNPVTPLRRKYLFRSRPLGSVEGKPLQSEIMSDFERAGLEKLTEGNFKTWEIEMQLFLQSKRLWGAIAPQADPAAAECRQRKEDERQGSSNGPSFRPARQQDTKRNTALSVSEEGQEEEEEVPL